MSLPIPPADDPTRRAQKRLTGILLMVGGGLIALLCGLCTLAVGLTPVNKPGDMIPIALIFGGAPTAVGLILFYFGQRIYREGRGPAADRSGSSR